MRSTDSENQREGDGGLVNLLSIPSLTSVEIQLRYFIRESADSLSMLQPSKSIILRQSFRVKTLLWNPTSARTIPFSCICRNPSAACLNQRSFLRNGIWSAPAFRHIFRRTSPRSRIMGPSFIAPNYLAIFGCEPDVHMLDTQHHPRRFLSILSKFSHHRPHKPFLLCRRTMYCSLSYNIGNSVVEMTLLVRASEIHHVL